MADRKERWGSVADEVDAELRFHFEERVEELVRSGLSVEDARRRAREQFGDMPAVRSGLVAIDRRVARRRRRREWSAATVADARHAIRGLRRSPGFLIAAVLTLGIGIGAVCAVFGAIDAVVLRPLPYAHADRLVRLRNDLPALIDTWALAKGQFLYYREHAVSFDAIGLYRRRSVTVRAAVPGAETVYATALQVSADLADVLSARVADGRLFHEEESRDGGAPVVLVSESFRRAQLGGMAAVVGGTLELNGRTHEIVGVLAADVRLPEEVAYGERAAADLWMPLPLDPAEPAQNSHLYQALGRLSPGVAPDEARAELAALVSRFPETLPTAYSPRFMENGFAPIVLPLRNEVVGRSARVLWILFGGVAVLLLITCANVGNLFLVRGDGRRREMAVRVILGAGRADLVRHRLAESLLVTGIAGGLGVALAWAGMRTLVRLAPRGIPRVAEIGLTPATTLIAVGLALAVAILFGLLPRGGATSGELRAESRSATLSRGRRLTRDVLVAAQVGLCFVLLTGAGLLVRSFMHLTALEPGFQPARVLTFRVLLPAEAYPDETATGAFYASLTERLAALPGVTRAGAGSSLPLGGLDGCTGLTVRTRAGGERPGGCVSVVWITPGYLETLGITLAAGTPPDWSDLRAGGPIAIPSAGLARRLEIADAGPGTSIELGGDPPTHAVTGIARDVLNEDLDEAAADVLYVPILPASAGSCCALQLAVVVRTRGDPMAILPAVRSAVHEMDPRVPVIRPQPMDAIVAGSIADLTFTATLLGISAVMALVVGAVGIYGVIAYTVALRRAEIGIRVALGARDTQVRGMVIAETLRIAAIGIAAGLAGTVPLARAVSSLLYGVRPADPLTLAFVAGVLVVTAVAAGWVPTRRALRSDPLKALRAS